MSSTWGSFWPATWTDGHWTNDLTGEQYRMGQLYASRPELIRVPGEGPIVPPDERPGWRWTSGGQWLDDPTGELYRAGKWSARRPGRRRSRAVARAPPDGRPGWRWSSDGHWLNDLTGELYRDGELIAPVARPAPPPGSGPAAPPTSGRAGAGAVMGTGSTTSPASSTAMAI